MKEVNRWHMNRMGLINFWLYDDQEFTFSDGKLMLRGQNASGKSITTQSFIPFILDGNRAPSRLDPFGSSDRKMEYYFLGNTERDDVTGYLYLEFKKENSEEYRTIGIGQRAQRGKSDMGFWAFVIPEGRRVGVDLFLTRKTGDIYIPLTKKELKNELGDSGYLYETRKEYAAAVNKFLFGFPRMEQYEQFIQLLIKVRAPKLSKEFKPSKVYDILNESLQTLTEEDLRSMVDAMEKMDEIETRQEDLKKTAKDLSAIVAEYDRYNRYMFARKTDGYNRARERAEKCVAVCEALKDEIISLKEKIGKDEDKQARLREDIHILEKKIAMWQDSDIHRSVQKKDEITRLIAEYRTKIGVLEAEMEKSDDRLREINEVIRQSRQDMGVIADHIRKESERGEQLADSLSLTGREDIRAIVRAESESVQAREVLERSRESARELLGRIRRAEKSMEEYERQRRRYDEELKRLDDLQARIHEAENTIRANEQETENGKDEIIEFWYGIRDRYEEYLPTDDQIHEITERIRLFDDSSLRWYQDYSRLIRDRLDDVLTDEYRKTRFDLDEAKTKLKSDQNELKQMEGSEEPEPERAQDVIRARQELKTRGIPFIPLYEAIDYQSSIGEGDRIRIEKQLKMSGLLDALIIPKSYAGQAKEVRRQYSDVVFITEELLQEQKDADREFEKDDFYGGNIFQIDEGVQDEELKGAVRDVLSMIGTSREPESANRKWVIGDDGYFRNGVIEGYATPVESDQVRWIGSATRRRLWLAMIEEKKLEVQETEKTVSELSSKAEHLQEKKNRLGVEFAQIPSVNNIEELLHERSRLIREQERIKEERNKQEEITKAAGRMRGEAERQMVNDCTGLPCDRTIEGLQELEEMAERYQDVTAELLIRLNDRDKVASRISENHNRLQDLEDNRFRLESDRKELESKEREADKTLQDIESFLADPENKKLAEEMSQADHKLESMRAESDRILERLGGKRSILHKNEEELPEKEQERLVAIEYETKLQKYLEEERGLSLSEEAESADISLSEAEMVASLMECVQRHSSGLMTYGLTMEDYFEDTQVPDALRKRKILTAVWLGNRISVISFREKIEESIEETKALIQEQDRELFENILSDTISRKLSDKISESRGWIRDMSKLMRGMDTSMGLSFELRWRPKRAEDSETIGTEDLERLLRQDKDLLTSADIERLAGHFRAHIRSAKKRSEEMGEVPNYYEMVRDVLDYRKWFEFHMMYVRQGDEPKELTDRVFNRFSGGEKAMAMYVPLFAAVNAQYRKTGKEDYPRILALDEAFAGVDDINIDSMFGLVETLGFDYIMNSQILWGCYESVPALRIAELIRPDNAAEVAVIFYRWNGKSKELEG